MLDAEQENKKKYGALLSNTFIFALGSFGSKIISFLLVPFYTNILTTEQYGTADLVMTCANIIAPIASLGIHHSVLRFALSNEYNRGSVFKCAAVVLGFGTAVCVALMPIMGKYSAISEYTIYLFSISFCHMLQYSIYDYTKAKEKNKIYAFASIISTLILAITNILLLVVVNLGVKGYLLANIAANIIPSVFLIIATGAIKESIHVPLDIKLLKEMLKYSTPLIVNNLSWWILNSSDKVMIEYYLSPADLGLYTVAAKIPTLLSILNSVFSQAWIVSSVKEYDSDRDVTFYMNVFKYFTLVMFAGTMCLIFILRPFMRVYVGRSFSASWAYVPALLIGTTFYSLGSFFEAIFVALKKNISITITSVAAAIVNISINLWLIPKIGVIAASFSTAISYIVIALVRMHYSRRYYVFKIDFTRFYLNSAIIVLLTVFIYIGLNIYICSLIALTIFVFANISDIVHLIEWILLVLKRK